MAHIISRLFEEYPDLDDFRREVVRLNGNFALEKNDMISIGSAYFKRYPDCFTNRNCANVTLGYKIMRICIIEKLVRVVPADLQDCFRDMFSDLSLIEDRVESVVRAAGFGKTYKYFTYIDKELRSIQKEIDELPTGMIKERFIGGVSYIYNIAYIIKSTLKKNNPADMSS